MGIAVIEKPRAVVVNSELISWNPEHLDLLRETCDVSNIKIDKAAGADVMLPKLQDFDAIIASVTPNFTADVLEGLPRLRIIARTGIGFNNIDTDAATKLGILVSIVRGDVERNAVSELAVTLLGSAARSVPQGVQAVREGHFQEAKKAFVGVEISGKTVGIIGVGNIGSRSSEILKNGYQCTVLGYDPHACDTPETFGAKSVSLERLLKESDFILLHCAVTSETKGMISTEQLAMMKKGAILVNTARGELVNSEAVIASLDSGHLAAYAADVFTTEPLPGNDPLAQHKLVIPTPHLGGNSDFSVNGISANCVESVRRAVIDKRLPERLANPLVVEAAVRRWEQDLVLPKI